MRMRVMLAFLVPAAAAVAAGTSWRRRLAACPPATMVQAGPESTPGEIIRLIGDAEQRLAASGGAARSAEASRFGASAAGLRAAIRDGDPARECRALATARNELRALPDDPGSASQRNAMALALDLTAAFIARGSSSPRSAY